MRSINWGTIFLKFQLYESLFCHYFMRKVILLWNDFLMAVHFEYLTHYGSINFYFLSTICNKRKWLCEKLLFSPAIYTYIDSQFPFRFFPILHSYSNTSTWHFLNKKRNISPLLYAPSNYIILAVIVVTDQAARYRQS